MIENVTLNKTDIFYFAHEARRALSYLSIENSDHLWAEFFVRANSESSDVELMDGLSDVFGVEIYSVDLKTRLPEEQAYLIKSNNQWLFLKDINHLDKNTAVAYVIHKSHKEIDTSYISFFKLFQLDKNYFVSKMLLVTFFINAFALTIPLYFNAIYGRIIPAAAESSLWTLSFIALLCFLCELSLKTTKSQYCSRLMNIFNNKVQPMLYDNVINAREHIHNHWGGDKIRLKKEIKELNTLLWGLASTSVLDVIFIFIFFFVIYIMGGVLVIIPFLIFSLQLSIGIYFYKSEHKAINQNFQYENLGKLEGIYISGFLKSFSSLLFIREVSAYYKNRVQFFIKQNQMNIMYFIISMQNILITVTAFYLIQQQKLSLASLFAIVILSSRISQSTSGFVSSIPLLHKIKLKLKYINKYRKELIQSNSKMQAPSSFTWSLSNVSFGYQEGVYLFKDLNLKIKNGEKIAFVGNSGYGKTSLLKLISGLLVPLSGQIILEGSDGQKFSVDTIRDRVHYLGQEPILYGESLITHLCVEKEFTDEQCKSALNTSLLNWLPPLLTNGLYTKFSELPYELSLPKKQVLAFSRFTLTEKNIWFFDSPTHLVDSRGQHFLTEAAKRKINDDTSLFLFTDNVDLFDLVERVIAFNDGGVIYDGPKEKFMTQFT